MNENIIPALTRNKSLALNDPNSTKEDLDIELKKIMSMKEFQSAARKIQKKIIEIYLNARALRPSSQRAVRSQGTQRTVFTDTPAVSRIPQVMDNGYQPPEVDLSSERVHSYKIGEEIARKKEEIIRQRNEIPADAIDTSIPAVDVQVMSQPQKRISLLPIALGAGIAMALKQNALLGAGIGYVVGDRFLQR